MLKSTFNWSGRVVAGIVLGEPTRENPGDAETPPSGLYIWDGGVPEGTIDDVGNIVTAAVGPIVALEVAPAAPPIAEFEAKAGVTKLEIVETKDGLRAVASGAARRKVDIGAVWGEGTAKDDPRLVTAEPELVVEPGV